MAKPAQTPSSGLLRCAAVVVAALALCWVAVVNGQPFFHPDTLGYVRGPDVAIMKLLGPRFASPWATLDPGAAVAAAEAHKTAGAVSANGPAHGYDDKEVLAGRSIYYGVLADLGARSGGFWLTLCVQAIALAWLTEIVLRGVGITGLRTYGAVMAVLILASPAAFFVGFLMPDIWVGIAIGALSALLALPGRLTRIDVTALCLMLAFAALAHSSTPLVIAALLVCALGVRLVRPRGFQPLLGLILGALSLVVAIAGGLVFSGMVRHTVGAPPVTPPFLTARVVADGTGALYAKTRCAGQAFVVCRYADRLPMDVDHFLWGVTDQDGVFQTVGPAERRALGAEQTRFALAVVRAYPLQQAAASLRNALAQMVATDLSDFNYKPSLQASFAATLPAQTLAVMDRSLAHRQAWPLAGFWALQTGVMVFLVAAMGLAALRLPRSTLAADDGHAAASRLVILVVLGVLANGAVCGVFSTLYGRYQARVIWLVPLVAMAWVVTRVQAVGWKAAFGAPAPAVTAADPA